MAVYGSMSSHAVAMMLMSRRYMIRSIYLGVGTKKGGHQSQWLVDPSKPQLSFCPCSLSRDLSHIKLHMQGEHDRRRFSSFGYLISLR